MFYILICMVASSVYTFQNILSCVKRSNLEDFKIYYQTVFYCKQDSTVRQNNKHTCIDKCNWIEIPKTNPPYMGKLFLLRTLEQFNGKRNIILINSAETTGYLCSQKACNPYFAIYTKTNLSWTIDQTIQTKTITFYKKIHENMRIHENIQWHDSKQRFSKYDTERNK